MIQRKASINRSTKETTISVSVNLDGSGNTSIKTGINFIDHLITSFGKQISMVTGRGKESVRYSLKNLLQKFDLSNSVFLEDESRDLAKPNPQALVNSINGMNSKSCLYVGDSMEDFIMAKKATILGNKTTFCGIIGTSKNPQQKLKLFEENGAILVLDSITLLPKVLNLE